MNAKEAWKLIESRTDTGGQDVADACQVLIKHINEMPTIVVLCGSTKFKQEFIKANFTETMSGKIVLSVGWFSHADAEVYQCTEAEKELADRLYFRKIDLADEVLVLNVGGYVGQSTRNEVNYAKSQNKVVRWLEPDKIPEDLR